MTTTLSKSQDAIDQVDPKEFIVIKGANVNNLKNLSVAIPRNKLVVITGLSGSGKSSLAFDTLYAEGQRMYVESLSSYARQFLGRMEKPDVEYIKGVAPAIAIEQKVNTRNPRSTVGTTTEIYDYLKLLFARIGKTYSPVSGKEVKKDSISDVTDYILSHEEGDKVVITTVLHRNEERALENELNLLLQKGFTRIYVNEELAFIEDLLEKNEYDEDADIQIIIDRLVVKKEDEDTQFRIADSLQTAFFEGLGYCNVEILNKEKKTFSDRFELDGISFEEPSVNFFSFNNPYGACRTCEGFGKVLSIDPDLVIPDKTLSVYENAIAPWRGEKMKEWQKPLLQHAMEFDFPIHRPIEELSNEQYDLLWTGNSYFKGLNRFFKYLESKTHKIQYRVMLSRYRGRIVCPSCRGSRLREDASYVKINEKSITDLVLMPISESKSFFENIKLSKHEEKIADRLLKEIENRLDYLGRVGLEYLDLNRLTSTLSGGEYQRIKLATSLGSALVGAMYVLDEPSIGLHPRDTERLVGVLNTLKNLGNTVIVVEHEEEVMKAADQIIDIGPDAGSNGGKLVFQGSVDEIENPEQSYTTRYLKGSDNLEIPKKRRGGKRKITLLGASENNLKNVNVDFPLEKLTVITGVSGSGKSTLVSDCFYPALQKSLGGFSDKKGKYKGLQGDTDKIQQVEYVDQNPIGKSSRSNPVTYIKAYDIIRQLMSNLPEAKKAGLKPASFSFNVDGGRCDNCQGEGVVKIEMQFMADIYLTCEVCKGQKFKKEVLNVNYKEKNIAEILELTVEDSIQFFADEPKIISRLQPLMDVGLGYLQLGQSSNTLSGGEAQRIKLASFLVKSNAKEKILFIFDEPTTGLHFHDIKNLLKSFNALIAEGHSVIVIEHNMEVIKSADWIIDLGPEGGDKGGQICFSGTPEDMIKIENNHTADWLKTKL